MDDYEFQEFGARHSCDPQLSDGWSTRQAYNVPQSWITTPNTFDWHTGVQNYVIPNNYIPPETHVGWLNPVMSAPLGGFEFSMNDAALQNITSYSNTAVPEVGYTESTADSGLSSLPTVDQAVEIRPASFAAPQSRPHHVEKKCGIQSCGFHYVVTQDGKHHMQTMHHEVTSCDQCQEVFMSTYNLERHASNLGHTAFICKQEGCEKGFTRVDTYNRHQRTHQKDARRFPCKYCKKYRGKNGFKRKDHLTQHVRNYHHIGEDSTSSSFWGFWCSKSDCTKSRPAEVARFSGGGPFPSSKEWINHMRTEHDESEFSCPQPGCDRVNGKGYFRSADLRSHLRRVHGTDGSFDMSIRNDLDWL